MKQSLHYIPAFAFLGTYLATDIYVATIVLIISLFGVVLVHWLMTREVHKTLLAGAVIAGVLGGLTLAVHDPMFIKLKPSVLYGVFALVLLASQWIGEKPLMARIPASVVDLPEALWRKINLAWVVFFAFCAVLNYAIAISLSEQTWILIKTFGFTALMMVFIFAHIPFVLPYLPKDEDGEVADTAAPKAPAPSE